MRQIDADALEENTFGVYTQEYGHIEVVGVDTIDAAPTIEPKRGEWIEKVFIIDGEKDAGIVCSLCGQSRVAGIGRAKFCPNCGADMRKEEK